jgi:hypothetical protein
VGWWGYVFVEHPAPPAGCELRQPTVVIDADPSPWETHFGCTEPASRTVNDGTVITAYQSCRVRLIHIATTSTDPWQATIDSLPLGTYAIRQLFPPD